MLYEVVLLTNVESVAADCESWESATLATEYIRRISDVRSRNWERIVTLMT